jgi:hypothetical protein
LKRFIYVFLLFIALGLTHKIGLIRHAHEFVKRDKEENSYKAITNFDHTNTKKYPASNKPYPQKNKKVKGTQPALYLANEPIAIINIKEKEHTITYKKLYYYQLFFSDKKRGPPIYS